MSVQFFDEYDEKHSTDLKKCENDSEKIWEPPGEFSECNVSNMPQAGDRSSIFWPLDNKYYLGTVDSISQHGKNLINYDDDDEETLTFNDEEWRYEQSATLPAGSGFVITIQKQ